LRRAVGGAYFFFIIRFAAQGGKALPPAQKRLQTRSGRWFAACLAGAFKTDEMTFFEFFCKNLRFPVDFTELN